ncbi:MAG: DegV family protein [Acutalibacteraceae bacterium]
MNNYVIFADSSCDIPQNLLKAWGIKYCAMTFKFDGEDKEYSNYDLAPSEFYQKMRDGGVAKTSAINVARFKDFFSTVLDEGNDVLYIAFASTLSTTYNCSCMAAEQLREEYPDRKIITVDGLTGSAGYGLLLYLTMIEKQKGASIEKAAKFADDLKWRMCQWFTVDDLVYLKRGGRISAATAVVGSLLGIKPILYMNDEGTILSVNKVRGRKAALTALVDKYGETATDVKNGKVFISHSDCLQDAELLKKMLHDKYGVKTDLIVDIGPVMGAHCGPGTVALFYLGDKR